MKFSIIVTYYQEVNTDEELDRCMKSIESQIFKDYEVILMHDGALIRDCIYPVTCIKRIGNLSGHNLRDYALKNLVKGDYILHTNADNLYYPDALQKLNDNLTEDTPICIMACKMMGFHQDKELGKVWYDNPRDYSFYTILKGTPKMGNIDLMQLCASNKIWQDMGGWILPHLPQSDGIMYQAMCKKYPYIIIEDIIGEHY